MIKPEQIPDEVIDALKESTPWSSFWADHDTKLFLAIAINAWPDKKQMYFPAFSMETGHYEVPALVLFMFPSEEKNDD